MLHICYSIQVKIEYFNEQTKYIVWIQHVPASVHFLTGSWYEKFTFWTLAK